MGDKIVNFPIDVPLKERIKKDSRDARHKFIELNFQYSFVYTQRKELPKWRILSRFILSMRLRKINKLKEIVLSHMVTLNQLMIETGYFGERIKKRPN